MNTAIATLMTLLESRDARVGVIGLGYVGLPLLIEFARGGFPVLGYDVHQGKVDDLQAGRSFIHHIPASRIQEFITGNAKAECTTDVSKLATCDAILICVPTPLTRHREPDMTYVEGTARSMAPHVRPGQLIILESTTYPGTTNEVLIPHLEEGSGLKAGEDFLVAYSPEREDPSNASFSTSTIPKVVGGCNPEALKAAQLLYDAVICRTVPVSSTQVAEATKLMENIFRSVNIALVNELKVVFSEMGINIWEVIEAAKTKPFGYMPFYPGPGLGGHCIPIDPFYLTWKAREFNVATRFIELAGEVNVGMPTYVVQRVALALNTIYKPMHGSRVLLVGLAYKKNVDDIRESPTFVLWEQLTAQGCVVDYYDPYCPTVPSTREHSQFTGIKSKSLEEIAAGNYDLALISTAHDCVDHAALAGMVRLVVDTRNSCPDLPNVSRA